MIVRILIVAAVVLFLVMWVRALVDLVRNRNDLTGPVKAAWAIVMLVLPFVGLLLYVMLRPDDAHVARRGHR